MLWLWSTTIHIVDCVELHHCESDQRSEQFHNKTDRVGPVQTPVCLYAFGIRFVHFILYTLLEGVSYLDMAIAANVRKEGVA
jgi:hypothetical protein